MSKMSFMPEERQTAGRTRLLSVKIKGFKSIGELSDFQPGRLTVLIGPNGAGKSNFLSFFKMLSWALAPPGGLQEYVGKAGGASALLHDGPEKTNSIEGTLSLSTERGLNEYAFRIAYASGDSLIFTEEKYRFSPSGVADARWTDLDAGHREARILAGAEQGKDTPKFISTSLRKLISYQFHNTSDTARIRQKWDVEEGRWLKVRQKRRSSGTFLGQSLP